MYYKAIVLNTVQHGTFYFILDLPDIFSIFAQSTGGGRSVCLKFNLHELYSFTESQIGKKIGGLKHLNMEHSLMQLECEFALEPDQYPIKSSKELDSCFVDKDIDFSVH